MTGVAVHHPIVAANPHASFNRLREQYRVKDAECRKATDALARIEALAVEFDAVGWHWHAQELRHAAQVAS